MPQDQPFSFVLILDVDGVTREGVTDGAHPEVVKNVKSLISQCKALKVLPFHVAFLSGTTCVAYWPSALRPGTAENLSTSTEEKAAIRKDNMWREQNVDLRQVFGEEFGREIYDGIVSVRGQVGSSRLLPQHVDEETGKISFSHTCDTGFGPVLSTTLALNLLEIYLEDFKLVQTTDVFSQAKAMFEDLKTRALRYAEFWENRTEESEKAKEEGIPKFQETTPDCFKELVQFLSAAMGDPDLKLIVNGNEATRLAGQIELHDFKLCLQCGEPAVPPIPEQDPRSKVLTMTTATAVEKLKTSSLHLDPDMTCAGGIAHREGKLFRFLIPAKSHKGHAVDNIKKHLSELKPNPKVGLLPPPGSSPLLLMTIGDTGIDIPMHKEANVSFHVGSKVVLEKFRDEVPHLRMVVRKVRSGKNQEEEDFQEEDSVHIPGTVVVLQALQKTTSTLYANVTGDEERGNISVSREEVVEMLRENCCTDGFRLAE